MVKKKTAKSTLPDPETREEIFLAKAAGEDVTLPTYNNDRKEIFLRAIAEGGGGGGGTGLPDVTSTDNGKTMKVVSGEWRVAEPLPEVISIDDMKIMQVKNGVWTLQKPVIHADVEYDEIFANDFMTGFTSLVGSAIQNTGIKQSTIINLGSGHSPVSSLINAFLNGYIPTINFIVGQDNIRLLPSAVTGQEVCFHVAFRYVYSNIPFVLIGDMFLASTQAYVELTATSLI